jgi:hypothetical protein
LLFGGGVGNGFGNGGALVSGYSAVVILLDGTWSNYSFLTRSRCRGDKLWAKVVDLKADQEARAEGAQVGRGN